MNKKLMIFGIVGLFLMALVAAGLVGYLGDKVEVNMDVESPMVYTIDSTPGGSIEFLNMHGGETVEFTITAENLANVPTLVEAENILSNPDGVTCEDIQSASVHAISNELPSGWETTLTLGKPGFECVVINNWNVKFLYGEAIDEYGVGRLDTMDVSVTFMPNALGTYTFTATPLYPTV